MVAYTKETQTKYREDKGGGERERGGEEGREKGRQTDTKFYGVKNEENLG